MYRENPAKYTSLAKNPPKYTTAYIVQQRNCRWHCEPTCFFKLGLNKEKSLHILPLCRGQTVVTRTRERSGNSRIFKISSALIVIMSFCRILFQKSGIKCTGDFTFCTAMVILHCTFYPAVLPSVREMRDIVKNDLTA